MERLQISGTLPFPINELAKLRDEDWKKITKCGSKFCLGVTFYMWCDDINGCVGGSTLILNLSTIREDLPRYSFDHMMTLCLRNGRFAC